MYTEDMPICIICLCKSNYSNVFFDSLYQLNKHKLKHKSRKKNAVESTYQCDKCSQSFIYKSLLESHKFIHSLDSNDAQSECDVSDVLELSDKSLQVLELSDNHNFVKKTELSNTHNILLQLETSNTTQTLVNAVESSNTHKLTQKSESGNTHKSVTESSKEPSSANIKNTCMKPPGTADKIPLHYSKIIQSTYECLKCEQKFSSELSTEQHAKEMACGRKLKIECTRKAVYKCNLCATVYRPSIQQIMYHITTVHKKASQMHDNSVVMSQNNSTNNLLLSITIKYENIVNKLTGYTDLTVMLDLKDHTVRKFKDKKGEAFFLCDICCNKYQNKRHVHFMFSQDMFDICLICNISFKSKIEFEDHLKNIHDRETWKLFFEQSSQPCTRIIVEVMHCTLCDLFFYTKQCAMFHLNLAHKKDIQIARGEMKFEYKSYWVCDLCPADFAASVFDSHGGCIKHWQELHTYKPDSRRLLLPKQADSVATTTVANLSSNHSSEVANLLPGVVGLNNLIVMDRSDSEQVPLLECLKSTQLRSLPTNHMVEPIASVKAANNKLNKPSSLTVNNPDISIPQKSSIKQVENSFTNPNSSAMCQKAITKFCLPVKIQNVVKKCVSNVQLPVKIQSSSLKSGSSIFTTGKILEQTKMLLKFGGIKTSNLHQTVDNSLSGMDSRPRKLYINSLADVNLKINPNTEVNERK